MHVALDHLGSVSASFNLQTMYVRVVHTAALDAAMSFSTRLHMSPHIKSLLCQASKGANIAHGVKQPVVLEVVVLACAFMASKIFQCRLFNAVSFFLHAVALSLVCRMSQ
eukprot:4440128-Amphidinium_carterae.1